MEWDFVLNKPMSLSNDKAAGCGNTMPYLLSVVVNHNLRLFWYIKSLFSIKSTEFATKLFLNPNLSTNMLFCDVTARRHVWTLTLVLGEQISWYYSQMKNIQEQVNVYTDSSVFQACFTSMGIAVMY